MGPTRGSLLLLGFLFATLFVEPAAANEFFVLPIKVTLPVNAVVGGQIVKRTLKEGDLVNLALGRPLGTKVNKKTEILAAVLSYNEGFARAVVYDPSQNGLAQITATVALPQSGGFQTAFLGATGGGSGYGVLSLVATTLGTPAQNGLLASTIFGGGGGKAKGPPIIFGNPKISASVTGVIGGRLRFATQGQTLDGFIVKGKGKVTGPLLGFFDDGNVSCGNGIIEPQLGEECEFSNDSACPEHCRDCICVFCGNNRIDSGEVCDGTADEICAHQSPPVACRSDCTGCQF